MPAYQDREAEKRVLEAVLFSANTRAEVMGELEPEHFYSEKARSVFEAVLVAERRGDSYADASGAVDVEALELEGERLKTARSLSAGVPSLGAVPRQLERLRAARTQRTLDTLLASGQHRLAEGGEDADQIAASLMGELEQVISRGSARGASHISDSTEAVREKARAVMENEGIVGLRTGIGMVDRKTGGLQRGRNYIVGGRAGTGKSTFAGTVVLNAARQNHSVLVQSTEMSAEQYLERLARAQAGITDEMWEEGRITAADMDRLDNALRSIGKLRIFVDESPGASPEDLRRNLVRFRPDLAVVDYLQRMGGPSHIGPEASEYVRVTETSLAVDRLKTTYDVPLLTVVQLNRGSEHTADHAPQLHHLRSSGQIEQDANVVMLLHREKGENADPERLDLYCRKNRHGSDNWSAGLYRQSRCNILTDKAGPA